MTSSRAAANNPRVSVSSRARVEDVLQRALDRAHKYAQEHPRQRASMMCTCAAAHATADAVQDSLAVFIQDEARAQQQGAAT